MEKRNAITLRITEKVKRVYENVKYHKKPIVLTFLNRYGKDIDYFSNLYNAIKGLPRGLIGHRYSITLTGISRKEAEAFIGYIMKVLMDKQGSIEEAISFIKKDLEVSDGI